MAYYLSLTFVSERDSPWEWGDICWLFVRCSSPHESWKGRHRNESKSVEEEWQVAKSRTYFLNLVRQLHACEHASWLRLATFRAGLLIKSSVRISRFVNQVKTLLPFLRYFNMMEKMMGPRRCHSTTSKMSSENTYNEWSVEREERKSGKKIGNFLLVDIDDDTFLLPGCHFTPSGAQNFSNSFSSLSLSVASSAKPGPKLVEKLELRWQVKVFQFFSPTLGEDLEKVVCFDWIEKLHSLNISWDC